MPNPIIELGVPVKGQANERALISALDDLQTGMTKQASAVTGDVTDDDAAATNGTALNVVESTHYGNKTGHLVSTLAGNSPTTFEIGAAGPLVPVYDSDAPGGVALYFKEDEAIGARFMANLPSGSDIVVLGADGEAIRVVHNADPGGAGAVQVYIDDNAASDHLKLLFVSPTNTSKTYETDASFGVSLAASVAGDPIALTKAEIYRPLKRAEYVQKTNGNLEVHLEAV